MPTTNVFEAILGRKAAKWDAFWHLFDWLFNQEEGPGLGNSIRYDREPNHVPMGSKQFQHVLPD